MKVIEDFNDYEILAMSDGQKVERWGNYLLSRPDPQIIWHSDKVNNYRQQIDATYARSSEGGGAWNIHNHHVEKPWSICYKDMIFNLKLMGFKHTGLFPEQAYNWNYIREALAAADQPRVLNLFAYTGAASVAALKAGASVVHVDSSKGMVDWAKENVQSSGLSDAPIRYIVDDVVKFVDREIRRGNKYEAIIMDPPSFGRGAKKEIWSIEKDLYLLVEKCAELLGPNSLFMIINSYTTGLSKTVLENVLSLTVKEKFGGQISSDELGLKMAKSDLILPCGIYARWER